MRNFPGKLVRKPFLIPLYNIPTDHMFVLFGKRYTKTDVVVEEVRNGKQVQTVKCLKTDNQPYFLPYNMLVEDIDAD